MRSVKGILCLAWVAFALVALSTFATAQATRSGDWVIRHSDTAGKVSFSLIESRKNGQSSNQSDWPLNAFQGVDLTKAGRQDVHFTITRDAGKFDCEGFLNNGEGAGLFHFYPEAKYPG